MNAISLYVSASRLLFQLETDNPNYSDLYRLVPYLRQSLSCTVCANLLVEPYSPQVCQHHVCRNCIGGRKNLKPTCSSCKTYSNYSANTQLRILLQCYKSLCSYILATPTLYSTMHKYVHVDSISNGSNEAHNLAELIDEGAQFYDNYKSNSGLPKSAFSILPCIFTSAPSSSSQNQTNINSIATMAKRPIITNTIVPPKIDATKFVRISAPTQVMVNTSAVSSTSEPKEKFTVVASPTLIKNQSIKTIGTNGTALYSVLYTGAGNKITIKRKIDEANSSTVNTMSTKEMLNMLSVNSPKIQQHSQIRKIHTFHSQPTTIHQTTTPPQIIQARHPLPIITTYPHGFKKPIIQTHVHALPKPLLKRKGCRCGNATPTPGKLTCCGQRCPCYVESKSCVDCKCRGCRNPHRVDGLKVNLFQFGLFSKLISYEWNCFVLQVRPKISQMSCVVPVNSQPQIEKRYLTVQSSNVVASSTSFGPRIKQEILDTPPMPQMVPLHHKLDLVKPSNDTIEYMSNDMDDGNIQGRPNDQISRSPPPPRLSIRNGFACFYN